MALAALLVLGPVACGRAPEQVGLPVFPAAAAPVATTADEGAGPSRPTCADLVPAAEAQIVLGLPLDGVSVHSVDGVPAPSVGRLARVTCGYSVHDPGWPVRGDVLVVVAAQFVDPASARAQWARNTADVAGPAPASAMPMGAADAALVEGGNRHHLLTSYGRGTVDLTLDGDSGLPGPPAAVLDDLARRALARAHGWALTGPGEGAGGALARTGRTP